MLDIRIYSGFVLKWWTSNQSSLCASCCLDYFKTYNSGTWTYQHFLNVLRETIILFSPYTNDWTGLDGKWFDKFIKYSNKVKVPFES